MLKIPDFVGLFQVFAFRDSARWPAEVSHDGVEYMQSNSFLSTRMQIALAGFGMWACLAAWSLPAFWHHISDLGESGLSMVGAVAGELALLALWGWHCFSVHINIRRWSVIFGLVLTIIVLAHSSALRGLRDAKVSQLETEKRLAETLGAMTKEQIAAMGEANNVASSQIQSQRERLAMKRDTTEKQQNLAKSAQEKAAAEIVASQDRVKNASWMPRWYLDGWCYSVIFIFSSLFIGIITLMLMNKEDVDANFDGIPDSKQLGKV